MLIFHYWHLMGVKVMKICIGTLTNNDGTPQRESMEDMSHRADDFLVEYLYHRARKGDCCGWSFCLVACHDECCFRV